MQKPSHEISLENALLSHWAIAPFGAIMSFEECYFRGDPETRTVSFILTHTLQYHYITICIFCVINGDLSNLELVDTIE